MDEPLEALFPGEARELPRTGVTVIRLGDLPPPPVRHALGYERFVDFMRGFGMSVEALLDTWTFAHAVRAHRQAFEEDPALLHSAVVFLGNAFIREHPECVWTHRPSGLFVQLEGHGIVWPESGSDDPPVLLPGRRAIGVDRTVPALLEADEVRFAEFTSVAAQWGPGSVDRPVPPGFESPYESPEEDPDPSGA